MIPQRLSYANNQPPWITRDIKRLSRKKQRKYNNARRTNSDKDWSAYCKLKKEIQRLCRTSHNSYISSLLDTQQMYKEVLALYQEYEKGADIHQHFIL